MNITKEYSEKELTLFVEGQINTSTSQELKEEIDKELGNFDSLIMDFTNLDYISSAGLRILISTQKKLKAENIPFIIRNVNDNINNIFKMSGFDKIFKIE